IARYNANGSLDQSFGTNGRIATSILRGANDVHVFSNGSMLVAGRAFNGNDNDIAILKLTSGGDVDESFGNRGLAVADYFGFDDEGLSIAIQADGRILVAGFAHDGGDRDFAVARFNTDGTLDTDYSTDGKQTVSFDANFDDEAREIKLDASGKAVLAGYVFNGGNRDFAIARLTTQGNPDTTFDADGKVTTDFGGNFDDEAFSLVINGSGVITAGGFAFNAAGDADFALAQYNTNGSLRNSFDADGRVVTDLRTNSDDRIFEIELDSSGRIVAAGGSIEAGFFGSEDFALARYNGSTGALDVSIGDGGRVFTTFFANAGDQAQAIDLDAAGNWVVGGFTHNSFNNFALTRYSPSTATLDTGFGVGGRVVTDFTDLSGSDDVVTAVKSISGGKTVVVGNQFGNVSFVARYNANGSLDQSFGTGGRIATRVLEGANDVQVFADGSMLLAGRVFNGTDYDFALLKLTSQGDFDNSFGDRGLAAADFLGFFDEARSIAIQSNGQILAAGAASDGGDLDFAIARFNTDGTLDTSYSADGKQTVEFDANFNDEAREIKLDASGKAVLAGYVFDGGQRDFAIARLTTQGNLDTTFDADGKVTTDFGGGFDDEAFSLVINASGVITAGGFAKNAGAEKDFALAQYNTNGSLRNAFDTDGKVTTDFRTNSDDQIAEIELDAAGRIVAAGGSFVAGGYPQQDFALARYNGNTGALDTGIGDGGRVFATFFANLGDEATAMDLDSAGNWVVGGFTFNDFNNFAISRFNGTNATVDTTFGVAGRVVTDFTDFSGSRDTVTAVKSLPNGQTVVVGNDGNNVSWVARYNVDGSLDQTFGIGGRVGSGVLQSASDVFVYPDGSMLISGKFFNGTDFDLAVGKLTPSGDIDTTFGIRGIALADFFGFNDEGNSLAVQSDGKILVAGSALTAGVQTVTVNSADVPVAINDLSTVTSTLLVANQAAITDINVTLNITHAWDADLDIFLISPEGTQIELSTDNGGSFDNYTNTIFDDSGADSIIAGAAPFNGTFRPEVPLALLNGESANGTWTLRITDDDAGIAGTLNSWSVEITSRQFDFAVARFNTDGTLDTDYSADGKQTVEFTTNRNNEARQIQLDPAGKAVLAGYAFNGNDRDFAIDRLTTQGNLDSTFDADGKVTTDFGANSDDEAFSLVISASNVITVGGYTFNGSDKDFALAQYNSTGTLRNSFDTDGRVTTDFQTNSEDELFALELDASGRIVAAGGTFKDGLNPQENFALARYDGSTGALDQSLGDGGRIYTSFFTYSGQQARALDLDTQGRWVVGGFAYNEFNNFAVARFGDAKPDGTAGNDNFVLAYSGSAPNGTVTVTLSSDGGPVTSLGTFPMSAPLTVNGFGGTDTVTIVGTSGADTFVVDGSGLNVNGAGLVLNSIEIKAISGGAGNDTLTFTGTTGNETATLNPGTLDVTGPNYTVHADSVETVRVYGGGGTN
ncbi:MAG TPA: proprotein convertase P-domain-containing protein, partial [Planctomycetaceae bacterium]|nr:proprotein convertase P-domain-containing protein [Planctomycetaceae bacterium]